MVSLSKAAYDVPVTGQPFSGTQQQGLHSFCCSSFAVWSIHVSRLTGGVAILFLWHFFFLFHFSTTKKVFWPHLVCLGIL